jgi:hypothetical protein
MREVQTFFVVEKVIMERRNFKTGFGKRINHILHLGTIESKFGVQSDRIRR